MLYRGFALSLLGHSAQSLYYRSCFVDGSLSSRSFVPVLIPPARPVWGPSCLLDSGLVVGPHELRWVPGPRRRRASVGMRACVLGCVRTGYVCVDVSCIAGLPGFAFVCYGVRGVGGCWVALLLLGNCLGH